MSKAYYCTCTLLSCQQKKSRHHLECMIKKATAENRTENTAAQKHPKDVTPPPHQTIALAHETRANRRLLHRFSASGELLRCHRAIASAQWREAVRRIGRMSEQCVAKDRCERPDPLGSSIELSFFLISDSDMGGSTTLGFGAGIMKRCELRGLGSFNKRSKSSYRIV